MTSQMEWSHDFCLSCDRQIAEGAYCSQACRLADLEKAGSTETNTSNLSSSASSASSYGSPHHPFYLSPAVNFAAYKSPSHSRGFEMAPTSPHTYYYQTASGSYFASTSTTSATIPASSHSQRSLSPSSSRTSLSSASGQSANGISHQAASQLNSYVRSFDQVRDMKRRYAGY